MVMVIGVHVCYFQRTQLITRIFVMLCVSILLYQARPTTTETFMKMRHSCNLGYFSADNAAGVSVCQWQAGHDRRWLHCHSHHAPPHSHAPVCLDPGSGEPPHTHCHLHTTYSMWYWTCFLTVLQAVSLWTNFMGITDGKEPLVIYAIVCFGKGHQAHLYQSIHSISWATYIHNSCSNLTDKFSELFLPFMN